MMFGPLPSPGTTNRQRVVRLAIELAALVGLFAAAAAKLLGVF